MAEKKRRGRASSQPAEARALAEELAEVDRSNYEELRSLHLPFEREPTFVFRARLL